ncbi:peptidoglycan-binding domain-containing protein [Aureimonas sp. ME7]|uniref:peptidoglycan-binding domain-containing protein n=1 Tax=Aureimonas sp. ME7 TaxID=2744252 RepID=UPI0015F6A7BC|nr:peptidoglycan-binding domain-containing protein [Aureimonas sp. ME7]
MRLLAPLLASCLCLSSAHAATTADEFSVRGLGAQPCEALVKAYDDEAQRPAVVAVLGSWVAGYLSHANRATPSAFEVMPISDNQTVAHLVVSICRDNPASLVESAAAGLTDRMKSGIQTTSTALSEIGEGAKKVAVRAGTIAAVQAQLKKDGYLTGAADGAYGPATAKALVAFQTARELPTSGVPDAATLVSLFLGRD